MSPEEQRILIAEACGWLECRAATCRVGAFSGIPPASVEQSRIRTWIPDYLNSLDAMHEAERVLTPKQVGIYREYFHSAENYGMFFTAAQRAETFLRCLGKWVDAPTRTPAQ